MNHMSRSSALQSEPMPDAQQYSPSGFASADQEEFFNAQPVSPKPMTPGRGSPQPSIKSEDGDADPHDLSTQIDNISDDRRDETLADDVLFPSRLSVEQQSVSNAVQPRASPSPSPSPDPSPVADSAIVSAESELIQAIQHAMKPQQTGGVSEEGTGNAAAKEHQAALLERLDFIKTTIAEGVKATYRQSSTSLHACFP